MFAGKYFIINNDNKVRYFSCITSVLIHFKNIALICYWISENFFRFQVKKDNNNFLVEKSKKERKKNDSVAKCKMWYS